GANVRDASSAGFQNFLFSPAGSFTFAPGATSSATIVPTPGVAFGQSLASFLLGAPSTSGVFTPASTPNYQQRQYGAFLADTIRMSHLTLDLGVRYEIYSPVDVRTNGALVFNPANGATSPTQTIGDYRYG